MSAPKKNLFFFYIRLKCLFFNLGTIFFPRWIINDPKKTVCFQNDHIPLMEQYRAEGPAYPTEVIDEFATITFVRQCAQNDESIIACAASELPADFPNNLR